MLFLPSKFASMTQSIKIIINDSEITAGTRGASLGPDAIMAAARKLENTFFSRYPISRIDTVNHLLDLEVKYPHAKRIDGLVQVYDEISGEVCDTLEEGIFPFVMASDHGSAGGTIAGIKIAYPDKRLGVIWIDAHGDLHTPYTTPSGNMHGMPLATAIGTDNLDCKKNELPEEVVDMWEELKNLGGENKLQPEDLVFIAVRDTEKEEDYILDQLNITNHPVEKVRSNGTKAVVEATLKQLESCDMIYVSFDVDSMDPDLTSHGTGTPVPKGLTPEEAKEILNLLVSQDNLVCIEFVEVNPCLDEKVNTMAEVTFGLIESVANTLEDKWKN